MNLHAIGWSPNCIARYSAADNTNSGVHGLVKSLKDVI
jgi:hypothetical protein